MRPGTSLLAVLAAGALASCGTTAARRTPQDAGETHAKVAITAAASRWPDQARYARDLAYDARRFTLSGTEQIAFRNASSAPLASVWLRVWANAFGGCAVARAHVTLRGGRPLAPGASARVALQIRVTAPTRPDRFGRFHGAGYFGNAIPILAVADTRGVQLPPYTFAGESFYSLTSSWRVRLRVPKGLAVASTGTQAGRATGGAVTLVAPR